MRLESNRNSNDLFTGDPEEECGDIFADSAPSYFLLLPFKWIAVMNDSSLNPQDVTTVLLFMLCNNVRRVVVSLRVACYCVVQVPCSDDAATWVEGAAQSTDSVTIRHQDQFVLFHVPYL